MEDALPAPRSAEHTSGTLALAAIRAGCRIRTDDIFFTREVLYQLS